MKKWIPSIKSEIEYYLQQSQLTHYPERKIAQFQLHIQALEREYKSFISKLRALDPTCKHTPWTPRAYCKRRVDPQDEPSRVKSLRLCETHEDRQDERDPGGTTGSDRTSDAERTLMFKTEPVSGTSEGVCADQDQDQPLSFDRTKLAVAVAAFKGPVSQMDSSQTQSLARVLQSGLPNLMTVSPSSSSQSRDSQCDKGSALGSDSDQRSIVLDHQSDCEAAEGNSVSKTSEEKSTHVLGLGCYSSSSDDDEEEPEDS